MEDDLFLIFVHKVGTDHKDNDIYEFIFSKYPEDADGEGWNEDCALGEGGVCPPYDDYIDKVGTLKSNKIFLDLLLERDNITYVDGYDRVMALAWENLEDAEYDVADDHKRLVFHYGDSLKKVYDELYNRDLIMKLN